MIDKALTTIVSKLKSKMGLEGGKLNYHQAEVEQLGKILCSVSHISLEAPLGQRTYKAESGQAPIVSVLRFRLNFSANFEASAYAEGLRHLATILHYLHQNPLLTAENTPNLDAAIARISISPIASTEKDEALPKIAFDVRVMPLEGEGSKEILSANII